jgi:hypothetical protein
MKLTFDNFCRKTQRRRSQLDYPHLHHDLVQHGWVYVFADQRSRVGV